MRLPIRTLAILLTLVIATTVVYMLGVDRWTPCLELDEHGIGIMRLPVPQPDHSPHPAIGLTAQRE